MEENEVKHAKRVKNMDDEEVREGGKKERWMGVEAGKVSK